MSRRRSIQILTIAASGALVAGACIVPASTAFASPAVRASASAASVSSPKPVKVVDLGISDVLSLLKSGKTTSEALVTEYLARIAAYDRPKSDKSGSDRAGLSAIITTNSEALALARERDTERAAGDIRGALHGVPILVKDNIATFDMPTTAGNGAMRKYQTEADATSVARLRDAGAIILAKTNLAEFALTGDETVSVFGRTTNPYNQELDVSGSSGGNAAAVAASFAAGAIGTDTAGSIIGPSANGALVGVRPTFGLTSQNGVVPGNLASDVVGPMAKTVTDAALLLDVIAGFDPADPHTESTPAEGTSRYVDGLSSTALQGARIGVPADWAAYVAGPGAFLGLLEPEVKAIYDRALGELAKRGAVIVPVAYDANTLAAPLVPGDFEYQVQQFLLTTPASVPPDVAALAVPTDVFDLNDVIASPDTILGEFFAEIQASDHPSAESEAGIAAVPQARQELADFYAANDIEAMVLPSIAIGGPNSVDGSTELTSKAGVPGVTVPSGYDPTTGRPLGIKLIGERFEDGRLLSLAYDYEQATQYRVAPSGFPELVAARTDPAATGVDASTIGFAAAGGTVLLGLTGLGIFLYRRRVAAQRSSAE
jgi:amidase